MSDFQQSNWRPESPADRERIRKAIERLERADALELIHLGRPAANTAVTQLQVDTLAATIGKPVRIEARIRHFGRQPRPSVTVELLVQGEVRQTQTIDVPTGGEVTVPFVTQWDEPGPQAIEVRIAEDGLPADDRRSLSLRIRPEIAVLLVNGRESIDVLGRATDYVALALQPFAGVGSGGTAMNPTLPLRTSTISEGELASTELSAFDVVFLCDVAFLSRPEVERLRSFVETGGGLVLGLGDQVQLDNYNELLHPDETGLLPVEFLESVGDLRSLAEPFRIDPEDFTHPVVGPFAGNPEAGLTSANFYRYVRLRIPESSAVRPAVRFGNGDPLLVERDLGAGRVLLVSSSLDDQWGSWALWPSFLPMIHELVRYAAAGSADDAGLRVGQPIVRSYPVTAFGMPVTVQTPDGHRVRVTPEVGERETTVTFSPTREAGLYRLQCGVPLNRLELVPVQIDERESDLQPLDAEALQILIPRGTSLELPTSTDRSGIETPQTAETSSLAGLLLTGLLLLLVVEQLLAWKPSLGMLGLAALPLLLLLAAGERGTAGLLLLAIALGTLTVHYARSTRFLSR